MQAAKSLPPSSAVTKSAVMHLPTAAEIQSYMPLVGQVVARFVRRLPPNVLRDDLVAAGTYGLIDSLRKNGEERGPAFEWYARIRIRGAILDELRTQDWLSRRARSKVTASAGDANAVKTSVVGFDDLPQSGRMGNLADENTASPHDQVEASMERAALARAVEQLPARERMIVSMHYFQGCQFKSIAAKLGVSEPRISQLHARAMGQLKTLLAPNNEQAA